MRTFFSVTWLIIRSVIEIGIVLLIFEAVAPGFETLAIACIGLVYTAVRGQALAHAMVSATFAEGLDAEFRRLRYLLKDQHTESLDSEIKKASVQFAAYLKLMVASVAVGGISLICILNILGSGASFSVPLPVCGDHRKARARKHREEIRQAREIMREAWDLALALAQ